MTLDSLILAGIDVPLSLIDKSYHKLLLSKPPASYMLAKEGEQERCFYSTGLFYWYQDNFADIRVIERDNKLNEILTCEKQ